MMAIYALLGLLVSMAWAAAGFIYLQNHIVKLVCIGLLFFADALVILIGLYIMISNNRFKKAQSEMCQDTQLQQPLLNH